MTAKPGRLPTNSGHRCSVTTKLGTGQVRAVATADEPGVRRAIRSALDVAAQRLAAALRCRVGTCSTERSRPDLRWPRGAQNLDELHPMMVEAVREPPDEYPVRVLDVTFTSRRSECLPMGWE